MSLTFFAIQRKRRKRCYHRNLVLWDLPHWSPPSQEWLGHHHVSYCTRVCNISTFHFCHINNCLFAQKCRLLFLFFWQLFMYARHEITGLITKVGSNVKGFKVGDKVGVGCLAASCLDCEFCNNSQENYCDQVQFTYNGIFWDGTITYGGYSKMLVADHRLVWSNLTPNIPKSHFTV